MTIHSPALHNSHRDAYHRRGMTLLEVLAVVVILGMLAATLTIGLSGKFGKARQEIARIQIGNLKQAIEYFGIERQRIPAAADGLEVLTAEPDASYYMEPDKLVDPWGRPYQYIVPGPERHPFEIISYGADGQPGGTGDAADISSITLSGGEP